MTPLLALLALRAAETLITTGTLTLPRSFATFWKEEYPCYAMNYSITMRGPKTDERLEYRFELMSPRGGVTRMPLPRPIHALGRSREMPLGYFPLPLTSASKASS